MTIWKRATVDVPPTEKSTVAKYVNGEIHICNGIRVGPLHGFGSSGWAAQLKALPLPEIEYPISFKYGTIESMTITRGDGPVKFSDDGWFHTVTDMQLLEPEPIAAYFNETEYQAQVRSELAELFDEWLKMVGNDPFAVSVRSKMRRVPVELDIRFIDRPTELSVEFTPMQPFCTPVSEMAKKLLEEGLEEKLANGNTATGDSVH